MKNDNIITPFNEYFEMVPALTDELKNEAFKLRYQVYCVETGFEKIHRQSRRDFWCLFHVHSHFRRICALSITQSCRHSDGR